MSRFSMAILSAVCAAFMLTALRPFLRVGPRPGSSDQATVTLKALTVGTVPPNTPVILEATISNDTGSAIAVAVPTLSERDTPYNTLDLYVSRNGAPPTRIAYVVPNFSPWKEGLEPPRPTVETLAPGQTIVVDATVSYDWVPYNEILLIQTGTVTFTAHLCSLTTDGGGQLDVLRDQGKDSNPVSVVVAPPGEPRVLGAVKAMDKPWLLSAPQIAGLAGSAADLQTLRTLIGTYSDSVYASYARAALAHMLEAGERRNGQVIRAPDIAGAALLADAALKDRRFALRKETAAWRKTLTPSAAEVKQ